MSNKRKEIIDIATEMFLNHGFNNTKMSKISSNSSISKRTIYKYFSSKEDLFIATLTDISNNIHLKTKYDYSSKKSTISLFTQIIDKKIEFITQDKFLKLYKLIYVEIINNSIDKSKISKFLPNKDIALSFWLKKCLSDNRIKDNIEISTIEFFIKSSLMHDILLPIIFETNTLNNDIIKTNRKNILNILSSGFIK